MARKRQSKNGNYSIGKNRPPVYTQFKPKQSGNPGGRPTKGNERKNRVAKKDPSPQSRFNQIVSNELNRKVTIQEGGKRKKLSMLEVSIKAQLAAAAKGNVYAQKEISRLARDIEQWEREQAVLAAAAAKKAQKRKVQIYKYVASLKEEQTANWVEAASRGEEPAQPWPHPNDIFLAPKTYEWRIRGPVDEDSVPTYEYLRAARDHLFARASLERRDQENLPVARDRFNIGLWVMHDLNLPERWQIARDHEELLWHYHFMPIDDLRTQVELLARRSRDLERRADMPERSKDEYKQINEIMKPLLNRQGYRSLAEFEHAFEADDEDMAWPKLEAAIR